MRGRRGGAGRKYQSSFMGFKDTGVEYDDLGNVIGQYIDGAFYPFNPSDDNFQYLSTVSSAVISPKPQKTTHLSRDNISGIQDSVSAAVKTQNIDLALLKKDTEVDFFGVNDEFTQHWNSMCSSIMKVTEDSSAARINNLSLPQARSSAFSRVNAGSKVGCAKQF